MLTLAFDKAPVMYELAKTDKIHFHFVNGPVEAPGAIGVTQQYEGPYYRFFDNGAPHFNQMTGVTTSASGKPRSPEDCVRDFRKDGMTDVVSSRACDFVQQQMEQDNGYPFDGVLGFSEGASVAASLILRQSVEKNMSPFKFAIFICGMPAFRWECTGALLADETAERIHIPTAHIVGSQDPKYPGSMALYNLCHQPSASIFDHRGDHTIPWDLKSTQGIVKDIRLVIERSR